MRTPSRVRLWSPPASAFAGFRFPPEVIVLAVCWYLRFNLSYLDVEELLVERGVEVDHVTVYGWVQRFARCWPTPPASVVYRAETRSAAVNWCFGDRFRLLGGIR